MSDGTIVLHRATFAHCVLLFEWANDAAVRRGSFTPEPIAWSDHVQWFGARLADPGSPIWLICHNDSPVGQVRLEADRRGGAMVHISLAPDWRHRGIGLQVLALLPGHARSIVDSYGARFHCLYAVIQPKNVASLALFARAGYTDPCSILYRGQPAMYVERRWE